ncbi:sterigmatocystin biosynthesis regulatory protein, putative [Talaromyces stipitatus ATCC 10500]|uniref:Sterigmatocystin biosynthesis regulatory protein, putative n=1 Tax=Talaromyces stipitatus (strain ATCC 10500 / CBS 375.48 / QM 6759 / NRRL 1006) TaxID=441959 RepID=B8MCS2_TALSN|nr:sterigmatocystin biosynthesis regulatory protein, putative [Talaromyces stipitatus ATCC 10500]EED18974.1 sterigmatocystin biosynthesis regulatory protein, putative [Talaromyces stipitatus ATCC 10500]
MSDSIHVPTVSPNSMDLVAEPDTLAPSDDVVQLSPRPPTTEYTDISAAESTTLVDPVTPSTLLLNALNWGFEDFPSPQISLPLSAEMVNAPCSFNDKNLLDNFIGFEKATPLLSSIVLPPSLETDVLQESEASCSVPEPKESHSSVVDTPNPGQTCCFLVRALSLLKQQSSSAPNSCGGCMRPSLENFSRSDNSSLSKIESIIADNEQTIQVISDILTCQCSQDIYLLVIMSIVILKILNYYTAVVRQETSFNGDDRSWVANQPGNSTQYQSEMFQTPPNVFGANGSEYVEDQGRMASQQILSKLHRIQRLINILSERFKTHKENVKRKQEESRASTTVTGPNMFMFLFPSSTLEHIEADLRLHLRALSADAANILCQAWYVLPIVPHVHHLQTYPARSTMSVMHVVPLEKRAQIQGIVGAMFGFATSIGPLICSALTSNMKKIMQLDIFSTLPLIPGIVYLMLALQKGGQTYAVSYYIVTLPEISDCFRAGNNQGSG